MPLINCPDCSRQVSNLATACPHCGHPIAQRAAPSNQRQPNTVQYSPPKKGGIGGCSGCFLVFLLLGVLGAFIGAMNSSVDESGGASSSVVAADSPSETADTPDQQSPSDVYVTANFLVKQRLKSPGTAKFPGLFELGEYPVENLGGGKYRVVSYVDAQNGFGGVTRGDYDITLRYDGKTWTVENFDFRQRQ